MTVRVSKLNVWLKHYLNEDCSTTFLNKTESARRAKYKCTTEDSFRAVGHQNFTKLSGKIDQWLNENGLSDNALKMKLLSLIDIKETKFIKIKGYLDQKDLPDGVTSIGTSGLVEKNEKGENEFSAGDTLLAIDTAAIETQRRTLDMALKMKNLYPKQKIDVDLSGELTIELVDFCKDDKPD